MTHLSTEILPVLPLRDLVAFPKMIVPLVVGRDKSINAVKACRSANKIILVSQKSSDVEDPRPQDLYKIGVVANVLQILKVQDNNLKVLVEGIQRVELSEISDNDDYLSAQYSPVRTLNKESDVEIKALRRSVVTKYKEYCRVEEKMNEENSKQVDKSDDPVRISDIISSNISLPVPDKQILLEEKDLAKRLEKILEFLESELEMIRTQNKIKRRVSDKIERNQRNYFLNEQLSAIREELGEHDVKDEIDNLIKNLKTIKFSAEAREKAKSEINKLRHMSPLSQEASVIRSYLEWLYDLPWGKSSRINTNIVKAEETLDNDHYGLEKIKERILEYLAVSLRTKNLKSPILCLVGPPGVGKTSLAQSVARATGRKFVRISLGGLRDEAEIRGHRRTYIGSMPGKIIQSLKKVESNNPVILLDEIDKMANDYRGDPASAMLEVLDPEQNIAFNDHYLEVDFDLSKVMFIATANTYDLPRPLLDRMEIIHLSGYTEEEKLAITKQYLIPNQKKNHGMKPGELELDDDIILDIIRYYTREAGVRNLSREIAKLMRKTVKQIMRDKDIKSIQITKDNLEDYLGVRKYTYSAVDQEDLIGITNGLAYMETGGDLLAIEVIKSFGKGEFKVTGRLGDVMKESVQAAMSYIRSNAPALGIQPEVFKSIDMHIHVPEGAVPKDGPSAGIAMCTSMVSSLTNIPVRRDIAMTGEITLRGRVLPIGGLREKLLAAVRGGVRKVFIPKENAKDLKDLPKSISKDLDIVLVNHISEVLEQALARPLQPIEWSLDKAILEHQESLNHNLNKIPH